ncbi:hypothetical protein RR47_GL001825 [Enterococcus columbae DSM 7374 = ATCC 51263]|nr:hypothetical protein RR47_GL001825 [Enterococcus columbae DSM 7374 = ATCC 51263]
MYYNTPLFLTPKSKGLKFSYYYQSLLKHYNYLFFYLYEAFLSSKKHA